MHSWTPAIFRVARGIGCSRHRGDSLLIRCWPFLYCYIVVFLFLPFFWWIKLCVSSTSKSSSADAEWDMGLVHPYVGLDWAGMGWDSTNEHLYLPQADICKLTQNKKYNIKLEAIQRWSAICRVWRWTLTYKKFILCIFSQGHDLYSHQKLNMYIMVLIWERLQTPTTTLTTPDATVQPLGRHIANEVN